MYHILVSITPFLSTLSLRRATLRALQKEGTLNISIHALLAESDSTVDCNLSRRLNFYPRSPCGERRFPVSAHCFDGRFLSTLSLRRATQTRFTRSSRIFISIHALLAESDFADVVSVQYGRISIHALLAESDPQGAEM